MRILLVEDAEDLADAIQRRLTRVGHAVDWQANGTAAEAVLAYQRYDLIVLDIGLPGRDGLQILGKLRRDGDRTPVLMLTARAEIEDRVGALDVGADDYLAKPFDFREFDARCRVLLRRQQGQASDVLILGSLQLDRTACRVTLNGAELALPSREYRILEIFVSHLERVFTKAELSRQLFGFNNDAGPNAIELYIARLRKKLEGGPLQIETLRGIGYRARGDVVAS